MKYLFIAITTAAFLVACSPKTAEIIEVTEETATSNEGDMPKADIGEGKVVFLSKCTQCHGSYANGPKTPNEINNFSKERIEEALPRMIKNAELNKEQSRQVSAYLYWKIEN